MSDETGQAGPERPPDAGAPQALVRTRGWPSSVWLIPLVAALMGLYLAWWAWSEQGPTITIVFDSAEGLEASKTKIRYKDVEVGLVETVELTPDLSRVLVTASLAKELSGYLTEETRFWVVRAQVSAGGISGLETVLSGAYIAIDPSDEGRRTRSFEGLAKAPIVTSDEPGTLFSLRAEELGSIQVGSPVYYRWLRVGQVAGYALDENGQHVDLQVFVEAPHDERVRSTTRFWNASGLDAVLTAEGLQIDTPSIVAMAVGGIAFETPATVTVAQDVPEDMIFELYPNKQAIRRPRYSFKQRFLLHFDESISGLVPGSPVEFRGFKLGKVLDVDLRLDPRTNEIRIPVVIEIEPERMGLAAGDPDAPVAQGGDAHDANLARLRDLVDRGLRARLVTGNLLTGQKAVHFDFVADAPGAEIRLTGTYPELPTAAGGLEAITERVASIVTKVDRLPFDSIGRELEGVLARLSGTLGEMERLAGAANADVMPGLVASLGQLEQTLGSADALISPDSNTARDVEQLVRDLSKAARSLRLLTERLEQHPEELLRGKRP